MARPAKPSKTLMARESCIFPNTRAASDLLWHRMFRANFKRKIFLCALYKMKAPAASSNARKAEPVHLTFQAVGRHCITKSFMAGRLCLQRAERFLSGTRRLQVSMDPPGLRQHETKKHPLSPCVCVSPSLRSGRHCFSTEEHLTLP